MANPFMIDVRDLPAHKTIEVDNDYVAGLLKGHPLREPLEAGSPAGSGVCDVDAYTEGENVYVRGTIKGSVQVACSRCVEPARIEIDDNVMVTFIPAAQLANVEEEKLPAPTKEAVKEAVEIAESEDDLDATELEEGDLDLFGFDGERVDLEPLLRESFVLSVPYSPLCSEDCKGLCSQCGVNLNQEKCSCAPIVDDRWAALGKMKLPS